jgi:hypothetical protein
MRKLDGGQVDDAVAVTATDDTATGEKTDFVFVQIAKG